MPEPHSTTVSVPDFDSGDSGSSPDVAANELYLIAHLVRGEPALDVATQVYVEALDEIFWIIPTSGHRAYPYWFALVNNAVDWEMLRINRNPLSWPPPNHPDHYPTCAKSESRLNLADALRLKPIPPVLRRI